MANGSKLREDYMRERNRIQRFIRRAEKRGYDFSDNPAKETIPKYPTQEDVDRLKAYTPERLYSQATAEITDYDRNGQAVNRTVTGTEKRKDERSKAGRRGYQRHIEAVEEGYQNVAQYDASRVVPSYENPAVAENQQMSETEYAFIAAAQSMPTSYLNQNGYKTLDEARESRWGTNFVEQWYKKDYPEIVKEQAKADKNHETIQGYTQDDLDAADEKAERDASHYDNARMHKEAEMLYDELQVKIDRFEGKGADNLRRVLDFQVGHYGKQTVADALLSLERSNPKLMQELDNLEQYEDKAYSPSVVSRAYRRLSDAITSFGEGTFSSKDIGNVMESFEVFGNV